MKNYSWFKFPQALLLSDPHVCMMPDSDQLLLMKAFCLAAESKERGKILLSPGQVAWQLHITQETWLRFVDLSVAKGWLEHCEGGYSFLLWNETQYDNPSDTPAETRRRKAKSQAGKKPPKSEKQNSPPPDEKPFTTDSRPIHESVTSQSRPIHELVTTHMRTDQIRSEEIRSDLSLSNARENESGTGKGEKEGGLESRIGSEPEPEASDRVPVGIVVKKENLVQEPEVILMGGSPAAAPRDKFFDRDGRSPAQRAFDWLPPGPWNVEGKLDRNFQEWLATRWLAKGWGADIHEAKANVLSCFHKNPAKLPIHWQEYQGDILSRVENTRLLLDHGIEIPVDVQERLIANQRAITATMLPEMQLTTAPVAAMPSESLPFLPATPLRVEMQQQAIAPMVEPEPPAAPQLPEPDAVEVAPEQTYVSIAEIVSQMGQALSINRVPTPTPDIDPDAKLARINADLALADPILSREIKLRLDREGYAYDCDSNGLPTRAWQPELERIEGDIWDETTPDTSELDQINTTLANPALRKGMKPILEAQGYLFECDPNGDPIRAWEPEF